MINRRHLVLRSRRARVLWDGWSSILSRLTLNLMIKTSSSAVELTMMQKLEDLMPINFIYAHLYHIKVALVARNVSAFVQIKLFASILFIATEAPEHGRRLIS